MKGFQRNDLLFSLCGLNCGLCPMRLGGHCGGCGAGNQSCKIARCSLSHGGVEYCFQCREYPCGMYDQIDKYDSFITHQNRISDMEKAMRMGTAGYRAEQEEKIRILETLLSRYNDGRRKTLYCLAVNLLEADDLMDALREAESNPDLALLPQKERAAYMADLLQKLAGKRDLILKLRKK